MDQPHIEYNFTNYELPGVYNVTYDVTDDFNNTAVTVWRTVIVKDTTPPVLHLKGEPIMIVRYNENESFVDPGADATDTGDDYYYELNRMNISACNYGAVDGDEETRGAQGGKDTAFTIVCLCIVCATAFMTKTLPSLRSVSGPCTNEHINGSLIDKIVTRVHHERLACERMPIFSIRNETGPICQKAMEGETMVIQCPDGQIINGYNFVSYGRPEGTCYDAYEPLAASWCKYEPDDEAGETEPVDVIVFNEMCLGNNRCDLQSRFELFGDDPCPSQAKWLVVEATCGYNSTQEILGYDVGCTDEFVQVPRLGLSGLPPLLGTLNRTLPGTRPGQFPVREHVSSMLRHGLSLCVSPPFSTA